MLNKLKLLLLSSLIFTTQALSEDEQQPGVNVPVTNFNLVSAIERLKVDTSNASKDAVLIELNKSNYLVAAFTDELHTSDPDKHGVSVVEKDSSIKLINISDNQGNICLLYTSPSPRDLSTSRVPSSA